MPRHEHVDNRPSRIAMILALALALCAVPRLALAQPTPGEEAIGVGTRALADVQLSLATRLEKAAYLKRPETPSLEAIHYQLGQIEAALNTRTDPIPTDYQQGLHSIALALEGIDLERPATDNTRMLEDVLTDLRIKNEYLKSAAPGGFAYQKRLLVQVHITTSRNGKDEPGYTVAFFPLRDPVDGAPRFPVSSTTNRAERLLPPGLYSMRLSRGTEVHVSNVEVGATGEGEEHITRDL